MRPCDTSIKRLLPPYESQSDVKKSRRSLLNSKSKKTNIDDLHDSVLVEIFYRLSHNKLVFQSKCVCKRWFSLISHDKKFHGRFLWHNRRLKQKPEHVGRTLIFKDATNKRDFFILPELELPMLKTHNFYLRFLPCFEAPEFIETHDDIGAEPIVVGTCYDLLLCCETVTFQRNYYICNPYTKQSVRLPPTPQRHMEVRVGFICDPYYNEDDYTQESYMGHDAMIQVNVDFRYAVVRIVPPVVGDFYQYEFNVEVFSSQTGEWRELLVRSPDKFRFYSLNNSGGVAYNGMLYWWGDRENFVVGFDPYSNSSSNKDGHSHRFRFISTPNMDGGIFPFLSVCQGGLRICQLFPYNIRVEFPFNYWVSLPFSYEKNDILLPSLILWEWKDDGDIERGGGGNWCNLTGHISLGAMVLENPLLHQWGISNMRNPIRMLAFDQNDEDILYLELFGHMVTCNIRERKLKETTLLAPYECVIDFGAGVFPFELKRWPTPLPRLRLC